MAAIFFPSTHGANSDDVKKTKTKQFSPGTSSDFHASVKGRLTLKVIHDNAMVTIDDMLVDALPTEMFKDFVDTINSIQNSLVCHRKRN